jgi:RNA-binding protein 5/10
MAGPESHSFEVITAEKALDENNRGNRMLRNMGWQEGLVCPSVNLFLLEIEREREL